MVKKSVHQQVRQPTLAKTKGLTGKMCTGIRAKVQTIRTGLAKSKGKVAALHLGKIYVADHRCMVACAFVRKHMDQSVVPGKLALRSHTELDLCNRVTISAIFDAEQPTQFYLAAANHVIPEQ